MAALQAGPGACAARGPRDGAGPYQEVWTWPDRPDPPVDVEPAARRRHRHHLDRDHQAAILPVVPTILHVDLDAFYAAVEQRDDPALRGKPVLVGGSARRGVVASCSYESRVFGIRSAMPMAEALRRCPHAIVVRHHMERYADASRAFFAILGDYSPEVEGLSLDEAFLDVTASERLLGDGPTLAREIKRRGREELSL